MKTKRVVELEELIFYHNDKYTNGTPEIEDVEYDELVAELKRLDVDNPVLFDVGSSVSYGRKIKHKIPMGSLNKATFDEHGEITELINWNNKYSETKVWSMKIDGLAGELVYQNGKLVEATTRGDGDVGSDITDNVRMIEEIPTQLKDLNFLGDNSIGEIIKNSRKISIRGEFYMPRSVFKEKFSGVFANCRNAASGALMHKDAKKTGEMGLRFKVYKVFVDDQEIFVDYYQQESFIKQLCGFHGILPCSFDHVEINSGLLNKEEINKLDKDRAGLDFDTDGIVFTINSFKDIIKYGKTGKNYRAQIAFKFKPEQQQTIVRDITWQTGRTGTITPVAELEPVCIAGSTVRRCTLHNIAEINRLNVFIGDSVIIQKAGDIIPKIVRVVNSNIDQIGGDINYPEKCPACGSYTVCDKITVRCENSECVSRTLINILHYLKTIGIKDIGESIISGLLEHKFISDSADLYTVNENDILQLPRTGIKTAKNYIISLCSVDTIPLSTFLTSLGINNLGRTAGKELAKKFVNLSTVRQATFAEIMSMDGFGDIVAENIVNGLQVKSELIDRLINFIKVEDYEIKNGNLTGQTFCCTGKLSRPRKEIQKLIEEQGGIYTSIKKGLNFLIIGDGAKEKKIDKARGFGSKILTEDEFLKYPMFN